LPPHAFADLLRGEAPVLVHEPGAASIAWERGAYRLHIASRHEAEEEVVLEPIEADFERPWAEQRVRVLSVQVRQAGVPLYRAELSDHQPAAMSEPRRDPDGIDPPIPPSGPVCRAETPRRIHFVAGDDERDLLVVSKDVAHNPPLPAGIFTQTAPAGVSVSDSSCSR
jgi:hypothetical protein